MPGHGYHAVMDANRDGLNAKIRYRQRRKLQVAMTDVLRAMSENSGSKIEPDATTAELAEQLIVWLLQYRRDAGVQNDLEKLLQTGPDLTRCEMLLKARRRETQARRRRRERHEE